MKRIVNCLSLILICFMTALAQTAAQNAVDCQAEKSKILQYEMKLKDWAQLQRYGDANRMLQPLSKDGKRVVFFGDSITDGWRLAEYFPGKPFINRGISGQTTPQMLVRFRADVIELKPKAVVILAGTNDIAGNTGTMSLEETARNFISMAELARANGIRVIFASVLPVNDRTRGKNGELINQTRNRPPAAIIAMNGWIKKYAADNNSVYLDYYSATVDKDGSLRDGISYDGLHPNAEGYKIMQSLAEQAIERALKKPVK